jgi:nitrous oxide reductase accessory protein NosL
LVHGNAPGIVHCSLLIALAACTSGSGEAQPPEIHYGEEICDACGMLISDASLQGKDGAHKFDDIGDLVDYANLPQK